jgi:hypothetical protein
VDVDAAEETVGWTGGRSPVPRDAQETVRMRKKMIVKIRLRCGVGMDCPMVGAG